MKVYPSTNDCKSGERSSRLQVQSRYSYFLHRSGLPVRSTFDTPLMSTTRLHRSLGRRRNTTLSLLHRNSSIHLNPFRPFRFHLIHNRSKIRDILSSITVLNNSGPDESRAVGLGGLHLQVWSIDLVAIQCV